MAVTDAFLLATMLERERILDQPITDVFSGFRKPADARTLRRLEASLKRVLRDLRPDVLAGLSYPALRLAEEGGGGEARSWHVANLPILAPDGSISYIMHQVEEAAGWAPWPRPGAATSEAREVDHLDTGRVDAETFFGSQELLELNRKLGEASNEIEALYQGLHILDELKAELSAHRSYDLRIPLSVILSPISDLLEESRLSAKDKRDLETIKKNALTLMKHANDLLDVSRLEAGKLSADYVDADLASLVGQTAVHFENATRERGIRYIIEAPDRLPARFDPDKMRRVLVNLLASAIKRTPAGGTVRCTLSRAPGPPGDRRGGHAILRVADGGSGVPPELHAAIFQRFFQAEPGPGLQFVGSGLGLALAKEFVGLHGGRITVDEAEEGGALVTVHLPLDPGRVPADRSEPGATEPRAGEVLRYCLSDLESQVSVPSETAPGERRALVLIVEDSIDLGRHIRDALPGGFEAVVARGGAEGIAKAKELRPDLILSDEMPSGMSGAQMVREIRAVPDLDTVPIVMLTSKADQNLRLEFQRGMVQEFLLKPFSDAELITRLESLVSLKRTRDLLLGEATDPKTDLEDLAESLVTHCRDLARSNEELRQFATIVSHDLKEPLRMVSSYVQLLVERCADKLDGQGREFIQYAVNGAERMQTMIDDLLVFCSVSSRDARDREISSEEALSRALEYLGPAIREAGVVVTHDPLPGVIADEVHMAQVFQNLIGNAIKFRGADQPRVHVKAERRGNEWVFSVSDNGIGVEPRHAKRIFVIFQKLHGRDQYPGSGIGLAICHRIVTRNGGRIWVEPKAGGGSVFFFTIPAKLPAHAEIPIPPAAHRCRPSPMAR